MKRTVIVIAVMAVILAGMSGAAGALADGPVADVLATGTATITPTATPISGGIGWGQGGWGAETSVQPYMASAIAYFLDIDLAELQTGLEAGQSVREIAREAGIADSEFIDLMRQARTRALVTMVAADYLTEEQAAWLSHRLGARLDNPGHTQERLEERANRHADDDEDDDAAITNDTDDSGDEDVADVEASGGAKGNQGNGQGRGNGNSQGNGNGRGNGGGNGGGNGRGNGK